MKKLLLCSALALACLAPAAFAQDSANGGHPGESPLPSMYISISAPSLHQFQWSDASAGSGFFASGWGVGIDFTYLFIWRLGVHASLDVSFFSQNQLAGRYKEDVVEGGNVTAFDLSLFAGPTFALVRMPRVMLAVSPGIHLVWNFASPESYSQSRLMFGLGGSAELAFNVTRHFFLRAGLDITFDFAGAKITAYNNNGTFGTSGIYPLNVVTALGAGFSL